MHVGVVRKGALVGFAFARILRGEFGRTQAIATLDAVGVEHDSREHGVGRALMEGLTKLMREKGVKLLQSEADWTNHGLLRFFNSSGFGLAPRLVLERSVLTPLAGVGLGRSGRTGGRRPGRPGRQGLSGRRARESPVQGEEQARITETGQ